MSIDRFLSTISDHSLAVLDVSIPFSEYKSIDLSTSNRALAGVDIAQAAHCEAYIKEYLDKAKAKVAYGGYLERRSLYGGSNNFIGSEQRNIHLGIDLWAPVGTLVTAVLDGTVHSYQNNKSMGDYGPTIILKHRFGPNEFYSLYGHLSVASLSGIYPGKHFERGAPIGQFGATEINVGYAPHLHFQIIRDLEGNSGDYPGVCNEEGLAHYQQNCPDPNLLLKLP